MARQSGSRAFSTTKTRGSSGSAAAKHVYTEDLSKGEMLRFQDSLPHLPVPTLEQTAQRYLKSVSHLVPKDQYDHTVSVVNKFISSSGEGPALQEKLLARAADPKVMNWIYDWWNDAAYLTYRDPIVPYVSYFYGHKDDSRFTTPESKGAAIATAVLAFKNLVDLNQLEPEYLKKLPLCMDSYKWMFNASRVAAPEKDYAVKYSPFDTANKTILVLRKNRFYTIPFEINGRQLTFKEFEDIFKQIIEHADSKGLTESIGAITSVNRDDGVRYRAHLLEADPKNEQLLKQVEASSFVIAFDDAVPASLNERAHQFWHGDGQNRYYDKPCQFIVCNNGVSGFLGEHSMMDGTPTCRMNDFVCKFIFNASFDTGSAHDSLPKATELEFVIDKNLFDDITAAKQAFSDTIGLHELEVNSFQKFGKNLIKNFKCSPDAFVQLGFQVAYYRKYGYVRPTYESATTRQYQLGRTEVCRSSTPESYEFVTVLDKPDVDVAAKVALARKALDAHTAYIASATAGFGCDRHLFGLKNLAAKDQPLPEIFTDPTYGFSTTWILSTSQLSSEHFNAYGWSQVTDEGYGIAYMINGDSLQFNVVSKKKDSVGMADQVGRALEDLAALFSSETPKAKL
ncbi:acyltransferase ChoActase/COT/CPT [Lipomyces oligophaga]|uniref:acyltransferase ChoActase/COT/CPT n=1 Tax=Lipomyces oligophaga TaxID=45792 RepID=UPI0034CEE7E4